MANYELGGDYYAGQLNQQNPMGGQQQSPLGGQQQSPIEKPFDFNALNSSIGNLQTGIDSILTRFDTFKPGGQVGMPGFTERPDDTRGGQVGMPGFPGEIDRPGIINMPPGMPDPMNNPYQRNEDLDLTDRSGIMGEYSNYIQGGMGSSAHTADMNMNYSFMGEDMAAGSSTGFSDFRKFLDGFGIGDRLQNNNVHTTVSKDPPKHNIPTAGQGISSLPQTGYQV
jgi:hypothetical protein